MTVNLVLGAAQVRLDGQTTRIYAGRDPATCQLAHMDPTLSRRHAELWLGSDGRIMVADYKATAKVEHVTAASLHPAYRRQADVYQFLVAQQGLEVSDRAWFVYANGLKTADGFHDTLHFDTRPEADVFQICGTLCRHFDSWLDDQPSMDIGLFAVIKSDGSDHRHLFSAARAPQTPRACRGRAGWRRAAPRRWR